MALRVVRDQRDLHVDHELGRAPRLCEVENRIEVRLDDRLLECHARLPVPDVPGLQSRASIVREEMSCATSTTGSKVSSASFWRTLHIARPSTSSALE